MPSYKQVFYTAINNSPVAISITKQEMPMEQYVQMISQDVAYKMRKLVDIMEGRPVTIDPILDFPAGAR